MRYDTRPDSKASHHAMCHHCDLRDQRRGDWLKRQGCNDKIIGKVLFELREAAALGGSKTLYDANCEVSDCCATA